MDGRRTTEPAYTISSPGALGSGELKIGGLPTLLVWVPLLIVKNYSEFQVNIFSNNRDIRKCQKFRTTPKTPGTMPGL